MPKNIVKLKFSELDQFTLRPYGSCHTAAATAAKVVISPDFTSLVTGATIIVKFTYGNNGEATLNVNNTGAKTVGMCKWSSGDIIEFRYNGTSWDIITSISNDYLPNQYSLKFGSKSYDGSSEQTITAADLGLSSALKYHGVTTTVLTDGATTNPIVINGANHTATSGCVVFYGNKEFVFDGNNAIWKELGDGSNHKIKQDPVSDPTTSGLTKSFIDSISQDANGKITVTKKSVLETDPIFQSSPAHAIENSHVEILNDLEAGYITTENGVLKVVDSLDNIVTEFRGDGITTTKVKVGVSDESPIITDKNITFNKTGEYDEVSTFINANEILTPSVTTPFFVNVGGTSMFDASTLNMYESNIIIEGDSSIDIYNSPPITFGDDNSLSFTDVSGKIITTVDGTGIATSNISADRIKISGGTNDFVLLAGGGYTPLNEITAGLASETFVTTKIAEAELSGGDVDLSGYVTQDVLTGYIKRSGDIMLGSLKMENSSIIFNDDMAGSIVPSDNGLSINLNGELIAKFSSGNSYYYTLLTVPKLIVSKTSSDSLLLGTGETISISDVRGPAYVLPEATATTLGGIKISSKIPATTDTSTISKYYPVALNSSGLGVVQVPWKDQNVKYTLTSNDANYPLVFNNGTTPSNKTDGIYTTSSVYVNPKTKTITALVFKGNLDGYASAIKTYSLIESSPVLPNSLPATELSMIHNYTNKEYWNNQTPVNAFGKLIQLSSNGYLTGLLFFTGSVKNDPSIHATTGDLYWRVGDPGRNTDSINYWDHTLWKLIAYKNDVLPLTGGQLTGAIYAPAFYETSDARKKDIKSDLSLDKCYDLIDKCQTVIYSLKDQTKEQVGMIAQEIEEFFPEVVATDEEGFKSLAYDRLVVICFKVLKDVIKRLEKLEINNI